jgi:hypothetical protein
MELHNNKRRNMFQNLQNRPMTSLRDSIMVLINLIHIQEMLLGNKASLNREEPNLSQRSKMNSTGVNMKRVNKTLLIILILTLVEMMMLQIKLGTLMTF